MLLVPYIFDCTNFIQTNVHCFMFIQHNFVLKTDQHVSNLYKVHIKGPTVQGQIYSEH